MEKISSQIGPKDKLCVKIERFIKKEEEGNYFLIPFQVPEGVELVEISYDYPRFITENEEAGCRAVREINIIDLGLNGPEGNYIGASGSDKSNIYISAGKSTLGFSPTRTKAGEWSIIAGAYKVQPGGVLVTYDITFKRKELRLLKGDTHIHTLASDGSLSVREAAWLGKKLGLDYIFITDHNNYFQDFQESDEEGITVLPGMEWTHYKGHAGLLGVKNPFGSAFCVNTLKEAREKLVEAQSNGALLVLDHPFCPYCGWKWGMEHFKYDAVEVWNGGISIASNEKCLEWWHEQLLQGRKIPIVGGSDFHSPDALRLIGMPCTCLYSMSRDPEDILYAIRHGNGYISLSAKGPDLYARAGEKILGETAGQGSRISICFYNLKKEDKCSLITDLGTEELICREAMSEMSLTRSTDNIRFFRFEITRKPAPDLPEMKVMLSNPIYFEKKE